MFESVLIANRGEIACRIIRTARRMGLRTIAVFSRADRNALHVSMADEAIEIGASPARFSYLDGERIIGAALRSRAQCVHPGYGFLSENADFAERCTQGGLTFVGPPPSAIRAMGAKDAARKLMRDAGVAVVPGYDGSDQDDAVLAKEAEAIGYPVLIKAVAGGGGKGMRRVNDASEMSDALAGARRVAMAFFGDARMLIEKYVASPRHIEVQIFADGQGHTVHLFERDCSLQRRHQKVIEEAPAPGMTPQFREAVCQAAIAAARAVDYRGAGTVEFIADASQGLMAERVWFLEMNTRLQVEHPVTECITGLDLVEWQFRVAAGEPLPLRQDEIRLNGHAIEARLYAENPAREFLPSPGRIHALHVPQGEGLRIDSGFAGGDSVPPHYDPMIAKVIAHGSTREEARLRLAAALLQTRVAGPANNSAFLHAIAASPTFASGVFDTQTIAREFAPRFEGRRASALAVRLGALAVFSVRWPAVPAEAEEPSPWAQGAAGESHLKLLVDGEPAECLVRHDGELRRARAVFDGESDYAALQGAIESHMLIAHGANAYVFEDGGMWHVQPAPAETGGREDGERDGAVRAPMHGRLTAVLVKPGEKVLRGQRLAIVEAMKMEHVLAAPFDGTVTDIDVADGAQVMQGACVVRIAAGSEISGGRK